jgi:hypothetical protein
MEVSVPVLYTAMEEKLQVQMVLTFMEKIVASEGTIIMFPRKEIC